LLMRPLGPDCCNGLAGCDASAEFCAGASVTSHHGIGDA